jgi:intein/homing endonuclease
MGFGRLNKIVTLDDHARENSLIRDLRIGEYIITNITVSKIYFIAKMDKYELLIRFTVRNSKDEHSRITVTKNHVMLVYDGKQIVERNADSLEKGDYIPRWADNRGRIVKREFIVGKPIHVMTENGVVMIEGNLLTCYVHPYSICKYSAKPVKLLSNVSGGILVSKPFYYLPQKLYNRFVKSRL